MATLTCASRLYAVGRRAGVLVRLSAQGKSAIVFGCVRSAAAAVHQFRLLATTSGDVWALTHRTTRQSSPSQPPSTTMAAQRQRRTAMRRVWPTSRRLLPRLPDAPAMGAAAIGRGELGTAAPTHAYGRRRSRRRRRRRRRQRRPWHPKAAASDWQARPPRPCPPREPTPGSRKRRKHRPHPGRPRATLEPSLPPPPPPPCTPSNLSKKSIETVETVGLLFSRLLLFYFVGM